MATRYWVGGTGTWDSTSTANWSATSGGASGASAPVTGDTVVFNSSSGASSFTVTVASGATAGPVELNNANAILNLTASVTFDGELLFELGRLNLNSYQLTIASFRNSSGTVITIDYGSNSSSKIIVTGGNSVIWDYQDNTNLTILNATTTTQVEFTYSGSTGTREVKQATNITSSDGTKLFNMTVSAGSDIFRIDQSDTRTIEYTSGFSGQGALPRRIFGNLILSSNQTIFAVSSAISLRNVDGGTKIIRSNGVQIDAEINIDVNTYFLDSDLTLVAGISTGTFWLFGGLNTAGYNLTANIIRLDGSPTVDLNNSTVTLTGTGTIWQASSSSILNAGTSTIVSSNTGSGGRTFSGGTLTYHNLQIGGDSSAATFTISGSNTFNIISSTRTAGYNFNITNGTTQTVRDWKVSGSSGAVINLQTNATSGTAVLALIGETYTTGINYLNIRNLIASPISNAWYIGPDSTINSSPPNLARGFFTTQRETRAVYVLTGTTSFIVPEDWNNSSNFIHIIGAGGGGGAGRTTNRAGGGGGGGGGYRKLTDQTLTIGSSISVTAGTGGTGGTTSGASGGTGGSSTWDTAGASLSAPGGGGGSTTSTPSSIGGTGGAGATFTGGTGGAGSAGTGTSVGRGGGGGGGAAGPNGNGGNGGAGFGSSLGASISGGGGGGNGGGTAGTAGTNAVSGKGGNNSAGVGGGTITAGGAGAVGGGAAGSVSAAAPGSPGIDILGGVGSGGGGGGSDDTTRVNTGGLYGAGGGGGALTTGGAFTVGSSGGNGVVVVEYTPLATKTNFLMLLN